MPRRKTTDRRVWTDQESAVTKAAMRTVLRVALAAAILVAVAFLIGRLAPQEGNLPGVAPALGQGVTTLGVDADPTQSPPNTATSLGSIESCVSVATNDTFDIAIFITDVVDLLSWETYLQYDGSVARVTR